jgi:transcriptional regulator with XRE-family HTH domain
MGATRLQRAIHARQLDLRHALAAELRRVLATEGVSLRALGAAIGVDPSHLSRVVGGDHAISHDALVAVATGLGYDVSVKLFEGTGPRVRDRVQARMLEALVETLHARWFPRLEIAVYRPVRGVIDVVLQDRETFDLVAGEGHSALWAVEQQVRWAGQKADSLDSARGWPWTDAPCEPRVGRLLLLRSCTANHELVATLPATFSAAYPGATDLAVAALRSGDVPWPGSAIVWVRMDGAETRLMDDTPRAARALRAVRAASRRGGAA